MSQTHIQPLCDAGNSQLLVIDIQERLASAMVESVLEQVLDNTALLCQAAGLLEIPVTHTEQYPKGLGKTCNELHLENTPAWEKTCFSCCEKDGFLSHLEQKPRRQMILTGMESHVCVLQTALQLQQADFQVFVVEDAVCSRYTFNHKNALRRLQQAGVIITSSESVLFEWLRDARHEHFKTISKMLR